MGKPTGFMEYDRSTLPSREPLLRLNDYYEIYEKADPQALRRQGARCMDCGVPFCQSETGCPIDNLIPEWNDLVYNNQWREAYERLARTNNFPEFTGRICPAPCEDSCVLGIHEPAVSIKSIECTIIDRAFEEGWVVPRPPKQRTGKTVAIVGSGPAGLAAADQLNKAGHCVTVFERDDRIGGLLMYGVPNMKLEKSIVQRRVDLLAAEGIVFKTNCNIGGQPSDHGEATDSENITLESLKQDFDAVLLACGALKARTLNIPGAELNGVERAMTFLHKHTRSYLDSELNDGAYLSAKDKNVIVIGGGDTGTDCIATAFRHGAKSVLNITRRAQEPAERDAQHPWPGPTGSYFIDYGHAEGMARDNRDPREYGIQPLAFEGTDGKVTGIRVARLKWEQDKKTGKAISTPIKEEVIPADLVLWSIGFTGPDTTDLIENSGMDTNRWGSPEADEHNYKTSIDNLYVAGDMRRGASLIVWAIAEGRGAAHAIDTGLMGSSTLPYPKPH